MFAEYVALPKEEKKGDKLMLRNLSLLAAVLLITAPAWAADVDITCTHVGSGKVEVYYDATTAPNLPNGFGLDIICDDANITEVNDVNPKIWVYPGTIDINTTTNSVDACGTPVAPNSDPGAQPGLDSNAITIEMAALYVAGDGANTPDPCGLLLSFTVDGECTVTISSNELRADANGVVLITAEAASTSLSGCEVSLGPACWNYDCFECGDATGDCDVSSADAVVLINAWSPKPYNACADFNKDDDISSADAVRLINHWSPKEACPSGEGCSPCTPI